MTQGIPKRLASWFSEATFPTQAVVVIATTVCISLGAAALAGNPAAGSEGIGQPALGTAIAETATSDSDRNAESKEENGSAGPSTNGSASSEAPADRKTADDATGMETESRDAIATANLREGASTGTALSPDGNDGEETASVPSFQAKHAIKDYHAHDDGSLNEWYYGYYIAHDWSPAGQAIANAGIGDSIIVDGTEVRIYDVAVRPDGGTYENMRADFGTDCVLFQTCAGDGANVLMSQVQDILNFFAERRQYSDEHVTKLLSWYR
jgi:hypothetical protein